MATMLCHHTIKPEAWEAFLEHWQKMLPLRRRHGFEMLFATADHANKVLTCAVSHPGDMQAAAKAYYDDPERRSFPTSGDFYVKSEVTPVEVLDT